MKHRNWCLYICTLSLLLCLAVSAQDATGRIVGTVTDAQGAVVAGAKVSVTNVETGVTRETTSGNDGQYQILQLPIGSYRASAEHPGFRKIVSSAQPLNINATLRVDLKLEVGSLTEVVQVEAQSTGVETLFRDERDPSPRSRRVFSFHRPETLSALATDDTRRKRRESRRTSLRRSS